MIPQCSPLVRAPTAQQIPTIGSFAAGAWVLQGFPWPIRTLSLWTRVGIDLPARACSSHAALGSAAVSPCSEPCCQPLLATVVVVVVSGVAVISGNVGTMVGITPRGRDIEEWNTAVPLCVTSFLDCECRVLGVPFADHKRDGPA